MAFAFMYQHRNPIKNLADTLTEIITQTNTRALRINQIKSVELHSLSYHRQDAIALHIGLDLGLDLRPGGRGGSCPLKTQKISSVTRVAKVKLKNFVYIFYLNIARENSNRGGKIEYNWFFCRVYA